MIKQLQHINLFMKDVRDVILSFFPFLFSFFLSWSSSLRACGKSKSCSRSVCVECVCLGLRDPNQILILLFFGKKQNKKAHPNMKNG